MIDYVLEMNHLTKEKPKRVTPAADCEFHRLTGTMRTKETIGTRPNSPICP
jgi:hypothetical protein